MIALESAPVPLSCYFLSLILIWLFILPPFLLSLSNFYLAYFSSWLSVFFLQQQQPGAQPQQLILVLHIESGLQNLLLIYFLI